MIKARNGWKKLDGNLPQGHEVRLAAVQEEDGQDEVADEQHGQAHDAVTHRVVAESEVLQYLASYSIRTSPLITETERGGSEAYHLGI